MLFFVLLQLNIEKIAYQVGGGVGSNFLYWLPDKGVPRGLGHLQFQRRG